MIYRHQESVHRELSRMVRAFYRKDHWGELPIRPRFSRFIAGPTGTGKTRLVQTVSEEFGLPFYKVSAANWIPMGANERAGRPTWIDIVQFCHRHERGIILLDETDKLGEQSAWMNHLRVEIFLLLDQEFPQNLAIKTGDIEGLEVDEDDPTAGREALHLAARRLARDFLLVGAGAFQSVWQSRATAAVGFHAADAAQASDLTLRDMHGQIPPEIANRFATPILTLCPLREEDYREMAASVQTKLPDELRQIYRHLADQRVAKAVIDQPGCRWAEEILLAAIMEAGEGDALISKLPRPTLEIQPS